MFAWLPEKELGMAGEDVPALPLSCNLKFMSHLTCIPSTPMVLRISVSWSLICELSLKSIIECRPSTSLSAVERRSTLDSMASNRDKKY